MSDKITIDITNLKALIETKTREETAKGIGCDTSLVTKHYNGDRNITLDYAIKYAQFFGVSLDYIVGISPNTTTDPDLKFICDYTGLNEQALFNLNKEKISEVILKKHELNVPLTTDENLLLDYIDEDYYRYNVSSSFALNLLNFLLNSKNFESFKKISALLFEYHQAYWEVVSSHKIALIEQEQNTKMEHSDLRDEIRIFADIDQRFENSINLSKVCFYEAVDLFRELISDYSNKNANDKELKRITKELEDIKEIYIRRLENANNN